MTKIKKENQKVREGWENAFKKMAKNNDDELIIDDNLESGEDWELEE